MVKELTEPPSRWVELAGRHADDFATRAAQHDRDNSFPVENFAAMKASGYTNMPIPEELGGGGASLLDMCLAQERLAEGDGVTALAVNMHLCAAWVFSQAWRDGEKTLGPQLEEIAREKLVLFGANTDPGIDTLMGHAGNVYSTSKAERVEGGFRINGRKAFGTNSPVGDLFNSTALYDDPVEGEVVLMFTVPKGTPGLVCLNDWDTMSMRASASHSWVFENLFVEEAKVVRRKPWHWDQYILYLGAWRGATFAAIYLGIARAARDFAVEYVKKRVKAPFQHPQSQQPGKQFLAAQIDIGLKAAWAFQLHTATKLSDATEIDEQALIDATAMQYFVTETAVDVVDKAMEMVGGAALSKGLPLERYYRDVRSGPMLPFGGYDALELIGKHTFGIVRDSQPRWV